MFDRIILHATEGPYEGKDIVLKDGADCIIGRAKDCSLFLDDPLCLVSRRHCRIQVSAPFIRVQDLGSRNGTYVNKQLIGRRRKGQLLPDPVLGSQAEHTLCQGDTLRVGYNVFQVELDPPPPCADDEARDPRKLWSSDRLGCC